MSFSFHTNKIDYLFITNSLSGGGAERAINIAVNELSKKEISVGLLVINDGPQDLHAPKVPTFEIGREWQGGVFSLLFAFIKTYSLVARLKPKILILNCDLPEFIGAFLFGPWKLVVVEHATKPWSNRLALGKLIRRVLSIRKSSWVVVSDHLKPWLSEGIKTEHIPNAIFEQNESGVDQIVPGNQIERLVFIGRLSKDQKQPQWMLDISEISKFPVAIYGDGLDREDLIYDSKVRNLDIKFHGFISNPWNEISFGDLLIVPSASEGDGLVVVEALSRGVPILLNSVADLTRFGLSEKHYCENPSDFALRISLYKNNLEDLVGDIELTQKIISARNPDIVATKWINYLSENSR